MRAVRLHGVKDLRFEEVPAPAAPGLEVRLLDGTTLRGGHVGELPALVRALRR